MGMFDSFHFAMECPYCKETSLMEAQTKRYLCRLDNWMPGEDVETKIGEDDEILRLLAYCRSVRCVKRSANGGFGMPFKVRIHVEKRIFVKVDYAGVVNTNNSNHHWKVERKNCEHPDDDWREEKNE